MYLQPYWLSSCLRLKARFELSCFFYTLISSIRRFCVQWRKSAATRSTAGMYHEASMSEWEFPASCELGFTSQDVATRGGFHPAIFLLASPQHHCVRTMPPSRTQVSILFISGMPPLVWRALISCSWTPELGFHPVHSLKQIPLL